jgi:EAL domain-containing protein (putative c-di-GMP-specific phosphodiesterase class I)
MDARMKARRALELALRKALENGEFELYYQPVVSLDKEDVLCCEALLRWNRPERGMVSPAEFIPVAEEIGLDRLARRVGDPAAPAKRRPRGPTIFASRSISHRPN